MKKMTILSVLVSSVLGFQASASELQFEIKNINTASGKILVALFKGQENYKAGKAESSVTISADKANKIVMFSGLSEGDYAVRYYHDQNDNGKLDTNMFGIPTEGYGFSNDAMPNFGPVAYSEAMFQVSGDQSVNQSSVIY